MPEHLVSVWDAFWALGTCRPPGFGGALPIPWTAAADFAERYDLDLDRLWPLLQAMDGAYLEHVNRKDD